MKNLNEAFVIVRLFEGSENFFQNHISFDEKELNDKCKELNDEFNQKFENHCKKNNTPFVPMVTHRVLALNKAISEFKDLVADMYH